MLKRGRPPRTVPYIDWKIQLPVELADQIDQLCLDPARGKVAYGARSALVGQLLRAHLSTLKGK
jgi:hypothetical protein